MTNHSWQAISHPIRSSPRSSGGSWGTSLPNIAISAVSSDRLPSAIAAESLSRSFASCCPVSSERPAARNDPVGGLSAFGAVSRGTLPSGLASILLAASAISPMVGPCCSGVAATISCRFASACSLVTLPASPSSTTLPPTTAFHGPTSTVSPPLRFLTRNAIGARGTAKPLAHLA